MYIYIYLGNVRASVSSNFKKFYDIRILYVFHDFLIIFCIFEYHICYPSSRINRLDSVRTFCFCIASGTRSVMTRLNYFEWILRRCENPRTPLQNGPRFFAKMAFSSVCFLFFSEALCREVGWSPCGLCILRCVSLRQVNFVGPLVGNPSFFSLSTHGCISSHQIRQKTSERYRKVKKKNIYVYIR